jgi:plastocyanin
VQAVQPALAVTYQPGVKPGDWWQYGDITGYCQDPCQIPGFAADLKVATAITRVTSVSGANVSVTLTLTYTNGTRTVASYSGDLENGQGNLPDGAGLIAADLNPGDPIFNSPYAPILNTTVLQTYAGAIRQANVWNNTHNLVGGSPGYSAIYFDKSTGIVLENKLVLQGAALSDRVTGTNLWSYKVAIRDDAVCQPSGKLCKFDPANITIDQGTRVEWNNTGMTIHWVTSCSGSNYLGCPQGQNLPFLPGFSSGIMYTNSNYSFTFNIPGNYSYYCAIHPWMHGTVQVRNNATNLPTQVKPPTVAITSLSPNPVRTTETVRLDFNVKSNATVFAIAVDWGDGYIFQLGPTETSAMHSYATTHFGVYQTYTINVTATNSAGQGFAVAQETVNDQAPTVEITSVLPLPTSTGQTVRMSFTASDIDGIISLVNVTWGDGSTPDLIVPMTSGSMCQRLNPNLNSNDCTIGVGDLILARSQDPSTILNNSIIVFAPYPAFPDFLVVHRVIRIFPASQTSNGQITFWTEGDANQVPDGWNQFNGGIPASQVVGVYQYTLARSTGNPTLIYGYDNHTFTDIGNSQIHTFTITAIATDNSGLTSAAATEKVNDESPSLTMSSAVPNQAITGQTLTVNFSATDPDGTISSITVNWGDGSSPDVLSGSATSDTHTYNRAGSFTITVTATDSGGSSTQISNQPVTITSRPAPASPTPTILGLIPIEFYALIGITVAIIATATLLAFRRMTKPVRIPQSQQA